MSTFEIVVHAHRDAVDAEESTVASIAIRAGDAVFSRLLRPDREEADDHLIAPPAQLAFWLVDNWWRARWEAIPPGGMSAEWRLAHELSSIGGGHVWPRLAIWGEGDRIGMASRSDPVGVITPVRFLTDALLFVPGMAFDVEIDNFLDDAVDRWTRSSDSDALRVQVAALRTERADPEFAAWRRLEARLGFDPDEAPEQLMDALADLVGRYGQSAVEEAAQAAPGPAAASTLLREITIAQESHYECDLHSASEQFAHCPHDPTQSPWMAAEHTARLVRTAVGVSRGPLRNKRLADILGTGEETLRTSRSMKPRDPGYGLRLRTSSGKRDIVSLKSHRSNDRRFEMSRALGDAIWAAGDNLGPIARSKTARQKFQRAFAQSLLCPFEGLLEYLNTENPTEGDLTAAAEHFHVSERVVRTVLVNKGLANREILSQGTEGDRRLEDLIEAA